MRAFVQNNMQKYEAAHIRKKDFAVHHQFFLSSCDLFGISTIIKRSRRV